MSESVHAYVEAFDPRRVLELLVGRSEAHVEVLLRIGGWIRGSIARVEGRPGKSAVLVGEGGDATFFLMEDVRALRVLDAHAVLDVLSGGRYEPVDTTALEPLDAQDSLQKLARPILDTFGIELVVALDELDDPRARHAALTAAETLAAILQDLGSSREIAGTLAKRLDAVEVRPGPRPDVRLERRRLVYVIDPTRGPRGRLRPERLQRNITSLL